MRWGFAWDRGPFEVWDIIGLERSVERMEEEGTKVPDWVQEMLSNGKKSFYTYVQIMEKKNEWYYLITEHELIQV